MKKPNPKTLLPGVAVAIFGLLGAVQYTYPLVREARAEQTRLEDEIASLSADAAALPSEQARERQLTEEYGTLQAGLPDDEALPSVLETLGAAATRLNVTAGKLTRAVRASDVRGVTAVDLDLDVTGTYARTQALVQTIAALPRAYTSRAISLTAQADGQVTGTLKLTTYKRENTPPAPVPPVASVSPAGAPGAAASTPGTPPAGNPTATPSTPGTPTATGGTP